MKTKTTANTATTTVPTLASAPDPLDAVLTEREATLAAQHAAGWPLFAAHVEDPVRALHTVATGRG